MCVFSLCSSPPSLFLSRHGLLVGRWSLLGLMMIHKFVLFHSHIASSLADQRKTNANVQRRGGQVGLHRRLRTRFPYDPHHSPDIQLGVPPLRLCMT